MWPQVAYSLNQSYPVSDLYNNGYILYFVHSSPIDRSDQNSIEGIILPMKYFNDPHKSRVSSSFKKCMACHSMVQSLQSPVYCASTNSKLYHNIKELLRKIIFLRYDKSLFIQLICQNQPLGIMTWLFQLYLFMILKILSTKQAHLHQGVRTYMQLISY